MKRIDTYNQDPRMSSENTLIASNLTTLDDLLKSPAVIGDKHIHFQSSLPPFNTEIFLRLLEKAGAYSFYSKTTGYVVFDEK